jgi:hypothetical protein
MNIDALLADLLEMLDVVDLDDPATVLGGPLAVVFAHVELEELVEVDGEGEELRRPRVGVGLDALQDDGQNVLLEKLLLNLRFGAGASLHGERAASSGSRRRRRRRGGGVGAPERGT